MIVEEARSWIGTPFAWQQSQKGRGCDCKGLVAGVARELGFGEASSFYAQFSTYSENRPVPSSLILEGMAALFDRVSEPEAGDVLVLSRRSGPLHFAICAGDTAIHAAVNHGVMETKMRVLLRQFNLNSAWRWRHGH